MEIWDLYTRDRVKTGKTMVRGEKIPDGCYRLAVHACLFNEGGEMLIQKRQPFKHGWSGLWDITVGGSSVSGEDSQAAVERELWEELGLRVSFADKRPALTVHFDNGFDDIYLLNLAPELSELTLQHEEVERVAWASEEEIRRMLRDGSFIPYKEDLIGLLFFLRDHRGTHTREDDTRPAKNT